MYQSNCISTCTLGAENRLRSLHAAGLSINQVTIRCEERRVTMAIILGPNTDTETILWEVILRRCAAMFSYNCLDLRLHGIHREVTGTS